MIEIKIYNWSLIIVHFFLIVIGCKQCCIIVNFIANVAVSHVYFWPEIFFHTHYGKKNGAINWSQISRVNLSGWCQFIWLVSDMNVMDLIPENFTS